MAKLSSVPNSNARLPAKFWRERSHAVRSPTPAVSGAATVAMVSVAAKQEPAPQIARSYRHVTTLADLGPVLEKAKSEKRISTTGRDREKAI